MPKGGARVGSGRKPLDDSARFISGARDRRPPAPERVSAEPFEMPAGLSPGVAAVWQRLAPHAFREGTLTVGTAAAFEDLCRAVDMRDKMAAQIEAGGLTYLKVTVDGTGKEHNELRAHPLIVQYRGMCARVEGSMLKFRLVPLGKPMETAREKPVDPFAKFGAQAS